MSLKKLVVLWLVSKQQARQRVPQSQIEYRERQEATRVQTVRQHVNK